MSLSPAEKKQPPVEGLIAKKVGERGSALPELSASGCGINNWARLVVLGSWTCGQKKWTLEGDRRSVREKLKEKSWICRG